MPDPTLPIRDLKVLDASRVLAGPYCGQILGDLGADVVKVERPGQGDETRTWGPPFVGDLSAYFLSCNRNKRAIALELSESSGLELFRRLITKSDVLLENFLPSTLAKFQLQPDQLWRINPKLIIGSISGFGRTGSWANLPGYDFAIQGLSGLMSITGPKDGPPSKVGVAVTDVLAGMNLAIAILACLHARKSSGHGYAIDISLLESAIACQVNVVQAFLSSGIVPPRQGNAHLQIVPYQAFQTTDDWLILAVGNDGQWKRFCGLVQRDDWAADPRFATNSARVQHRDALVPMLESLFQTRSQKDWQSLLEEHDIPCAPVWNYAQLFSQPICAERGLRVTVRDHDGRPVDLAGSPFHVNGEQLPTRLMPPRVGEQTAEVLRDWLNASDGEIQALGRSG